MVALLFCIVFSLASAILYRLGGAAGYNTKFRDLGCPALQTIFLIILGFHNPISLLFSFGITFGALTTYWDFINEKDNFWLHGFFVGLAAFPIVMASGHWWLFIARCVILAVWSGVWSQVWKWDVAEESGRLLPLIPTLYMIV